MDSYIFTSLAKWEDLAYLLDCSRGDLPHRLQVWRAQPLTDIRPVYGDGFAGGGYVREVLN